MIFTIVIILIVALVVMAIVINAIQQHKERMEAEKRAEIAKQKAIVDETEDVLMSSGQIPVSPQLMQILHARIHDALKLMYDLNPSAIDIKQRLHEADQRAANPPTEAQVTEANMVLPDNEKQIIVLIQGIKKLRALLRSEHSKGKVDSHLFIVEDKRLDALQLKVNVETLMKRGLNAEETQMLGSARQYYEKGLAAIAATTEQTDYTRQRKQAIEERLFAITNSLKNANAADRAKRQEEEANDLDVLFAPKKKW